RRPLDPRRWPAAGMPGLLGRDDIAASVHELNVVLTNDGTKVDLVIEKKPSVLFVCVKNAGKSQMSAALIRQVAGDSGRVHLAGDAPGAALGALSAAVCAQVRPTMPGDRPKPIDLTMLQTADRVVGIGNEGVGEPVPGVAGTIETWTIDEPSVRGIEGEE